jgi:hypothetical protein
MTQKILILWVCTCLSIAATAQTKSTLSAETGNNTSACSAKGTPSYCFEQLTDLTTVIPGNSNAQTQHLTPLGHVSPLTIKKSYLYTGATTRIVAAYQPWFSPQTGSYPCTQFVSGGDEDDPGHPCSGYSENDTATVKLQHTKMLNRGFTDVSPDWYGNCDGLSDCSSNQTFLNNTVIAEAVDLNSRSGHPLHMMIMIDKGLITSGMTATANNSAAVGCPTSGTTTTCVTAVLEAAYDYIDANWGRQPYYSTDSVSGEPITLTFIIESDFSGPDWSTVWSNVKSYMSKYATPYKIVKEFGDFTENHIDGAYAWPQSSLFNNNSPNTQFCWQGGWTGSACDNYIGRYYSQAQGSGEIQMGALYIGFDGSNNNYNHRVTARQCGQVLGFLGNAISTAGYTSSSQLPWLLVPTWNDLGEATNVENGVDTCWRIPTPSVTGTILTWTQTKNDATYTSPDTIDHFKIWYGSGAGDLTLSQDNISPTTACNSAVTSCTFDLSKASFPPPTGHTWYIYVEQIPKALLLIEMNGGGNGNGPPVSHQF